LLEALNWADSERKADLTKSAAVAAAAATVTTVDVEMESNTTNLSSPSISVSLLPPSLTTKNASNSTSGESSMSQSTSSGSASTSAPKQVLGLRLPKQGGSSAPELEAYLTLLLLSMLTQPLRQRSHPKRAEYSEMVRSLSSRMIDVVTAANRRTLDFFQARAYALLACAHEASSQPLLLLQPRLAAAYRTSTLRHDEFGQAVYLNLLLRCYLGFSISGEVEPSLVNIESAQSLITKTAFPEGASNSQFVRYLLYTGRVHAVQLRYSDAYRSLLQAVRKSPTGAVGFRTLAQKFAIVVQLLMGEIPERSDFALPESKIALAPYLVLSRAVRHGDIAEFKATVATHSAVFARDSTLTLVQRLEANVIKSGLRRIAMSYSRISFAAIAQRLARGSAEDAEFLCAQAVRDGIIDAVLHHDTGYLESRVMPNIYSGKEPQENFKRRIDFCLTVHDESQRAMRFPPPGGAAADLEGAEERREREREEAELLGELDEKGDDYFDDDGDL
jgi:26S proteasome regulatory subunit N3